MSYLLGIDLGGTKIEGAVLDKDDDLKEIIRKRIPTEKEHGYEHIMNNIVKLIHQLEEEVGYKFENVGMGTPGSIDSVSGLMKNSNTICLNGQTFQKDIASLLNKKVKVANDANCFAIAETKLGIVKDECPDARLVFGVIMGTGAGGGLVFNGEVWNGLHGIGGEWGHSFLDDTGGACYCGNIGCVETVISGPFTEKWYQSLAGQHKSLKEIIELYRTGNDINATKTIERLLDRFGRGMANIVNILDPDAIVIGGGVGNIDELYSIGREKTIQYLFNDYLNTPFLKPKLGDSAGVYGAALL